MTKTLSAKEVAVALETTPKRLRKFLRSETPVEDRPGKGGRWVIPAGKVNSLKKKFKDWSAEENRKRIERLQSEVDETEDDAVEDDSEETTDED